MTLQTNDHSDKQLNTLVEIALQYVPAMGVGNPLPLGCYG